MKTRAGFSELNSFISSNQNQREYKIENYLGNTTWRAREPRSDEGQFIIDCSHFEANYKHHIISYDSYVQYLTYHLLWYVIFDMQYAICYMLNAFEKINSLDETESIIPERFS